MIGADSEPGSREQVGHEARQEHEVRQEQGRYEQDRPGPGQPAAGTDLATLAGLPTEELRQRAFARARARHDLKFFWSVIQHLPHASAAEGLDGALGAYPASVDDAVALWREFTGHDYGDREPLLRAAFVEYLRGGDPS